MKINMSRQTTTVSMKY